MNEGPAQSPGPASGALTLVVRQTIRAPVARLFALWTDAGHLAKWWGPRGVACIGAEIDLRVGGRYRIGNRLPDGCELWIEGEFERIEAPNLLVYSWRIHPSSSPERVSVRFSSQSPHSTEVIVTHERIPDLLTKDRHAAGWAGCLDGLAAYAGPAPASLKLQS